MEKLDQAVKEKQPARDQHKWELLQYWCKSIPVFTLSSWLRARIWLYWENIVLITLFLCFKIIIDHFTIIMWRNYLTLENTSEESCFPIINY